MKIWENLTDGQLISQLVEQSELDALRIARMVIHRTVPVVAAEIDKHLAVLETT